ncbi:hypothetical protein EOM86_02740 [Candidatus Nomurabacteria bacterium]|nr:hypothetical protein [Candidatus Nomurabacteria bacterium]
MIYEYTTDDSIPEEERRNIVVVTTLKKNLAIQELKGLFESRGNLQLFNKMFLFLNSLSEIVIERFDPEMEESIYDALGKNDTTIAFVTALIGIKSSEKNGKNGETMKLAKNNFAEHIEPKLRKLARSALRREKRTYKERLALVDSDKKWGWLAQLYPSIYSRVRRIFFMSADKFVMRNDTLIDKSSSTYDSFIINGAIVFIDEFDSTKNQILNRLIENNARRKIDYIDFVIKIFNGLNIENVPSDIYVPHKDFEGDLKKSHRYVQNKVKSLITKNHLDKPIKLDKDCQKQKAFIFSGSNTYMINGISDSVLLTYNKDANRNDLVYFNGEKVKNKKLYSLLDDIGYAIDSFCRFVSQLATNYQKKLDDRTIGYEDCILTILDVYGIGDSLMPYQSYLKDMILLHSSSAKEKIIGEDASVYERGFEYFFLRDDTSNNERTIIELVSFPVSAEKILLKVCEQALVIGMSATAGLRTVIGNYDLEYLAAKLEDRFLPSIDREPILINKMEESRCKYDRNRIKVSSVSSKVAGQYSHDLWNEIISTDKYRNQVINDLDNYNDYDKGRYFQVAKAFSEFARNSKVHAGLFFCNKHPKANDNTFNEGVIRFIFSIIIDENKALLPDGFSYDSSVFYLRGDDYDGTKGSIRDYLAEGNKAVVITTYNTVGAGQNLQYKIPAGRAVYNVSDYPDRDETDFDFLFLQAPTHLIDVPEYSEDGVSKAKAIAQANYLLQNGEISEADCKFIVSAILSFDPSELRVASGLMRKSRSAMRYAASRIIQAVGRICRTNMKNEETVILYDEDISNFVTEPLGDYGAVNVETEELIKAVSKQVKPTKEEEDYENVAVYRSHNAMKVINGLKSVWSDEHIVAYTKMRLDVLSHPTTDNLNNTSYQMYVEAPSPTDRYLVSYKGEFSNLHISFGGHLRNGHVVSEDSIRLPDFMKIPGLRGYFEENGYATRFDPAKYIMTPVAAKNFYKGIIGEVAGTFVLAKFGIILEELERKFFERFDAQLSSNVAVDFKHWSSEFFTTKNVQFDKIVKKMKETGHTTVFVINMFLPEGKAKETLCDTIDGLRIVRAPWLFDPETGEYNTEIISELKRY